MSPPVSAPPSPVLADLLAKLADVSWLALDPDYELYKYAAIVVLASSHRSRTYHKPDGREYVVEGIDQFRDVFVPTEIVKWAGMEGYEPRFEAEVPEVPADFLECKDLRPVPESSAYRGAMRTVDPSFHGHAFRDTIELAIAGLRGFLSFRGRELGRSIRAFAWPFVWLTWTRSGSSLIVMPNAAGTLSVLKPE